MVIAKPQPRDEAETMTGARDQGTRPARIARRPRLAARIRTLWRFTPLWRVRGHRCDDRHVEREHWICNRAVPVRDWLGK